MLFVRWFLLVSYYQVVLPLTDFGAYHKLAICNCILVIMLPLVKIVGCGVSKAMVGETG